MDDPDGKDLLSLNEAGRPGLESIMKIANHISEKSFKGTMRSLLRHAVVLCSFPESSLRTRVTFEIGMQKLGAAVVNVSGILERNERLEDVAGYLSNWVQAAVIRHGNYETLRRFAQHAAFPVVNAMTDDNHPCEVLTDVYALRKLRGELTNLKFVFIGAGTNVCRSWVAAASIFGLTFTQVCPTGLVAPELLNETRGSARSASLTYTADMNSAMEQADVILTDGWPTKHRSLLEGYSITPKHLNRCANDCLLWPCPPVHWGEEISADLYGSKSFAGYSSKRDLLSIQQAIVLWAQGISL